jgi:hypothetical protein
METQYIMKLLLARIKVSMKEHMQEMTARMDANQAEMKADRKAHQARMNAKHKEMMAMLDAHHERMMTCLGKTEKIQRRLNPIQELCSPQRSIKKSPREKPQCCRSENRGSGVGSGIWPQSAARK